MFKINSSSTFINTYLTFTQIITKRITVTVLIIITIVIIGILYYHYIIYKHRWNIQLSLGYTTSIMVNTLSKTTTRISISIKLFMSNFHRYRFTCMNTDSEQMLRPGLPTLPTKWVCVSLRSNKKNSASSLFADTILKKSIPNREMQLGFTKSIV